MAQFALPFLALCLLVLASSVRSAQLTEAATADHVTALPGLNIKTNFKHYSGYLESNNGQFLHYWFFESQSAHPEKDPVVLWLNGGPGCSSMLGALAELGPIRVHRNGSVSINPHAWNQKANILFLESPAGVGFSYKVDSNYKADDASTAQLNFDALNAFFKKFPNLAENDFYVAGESYAGIYIPMLSMLLLEHKFPKNFKGVAIGNGYLDVSLLGNSVIHWYYGHGLISSTAYDHMIKVCCPATSSDLRHCDIVGNHNHTCVTARNAAAGAAHRAHLNMYNIYGDCLHDPKHSNSSSTLSSHQVMDRLLFDSLNLDEDYEYYASNNGNSPPCLSQDYLAQWLNSAETRKALNIGEKSLKWFPCSSSIKYHRQEKTMKSQVKHMVDAGLRVLIYNGDIDSVCNFLGDQWFVEDLGYRTRIAYHPWTVGEKVGGFTTFYDHQLTFLTVRGAGHMVPEDKGHEALHMFNQYLGFQN